MPEVHVPISRTVTLIAHPARRPSSHAMAQARALSLLAPARTNIMLMVRLRHLLPAHTHTNHLTDDQVLQAIAAEVAHHTMILQIRTAQPAQTRIKFSDLAKNYPTNQKYPTTPTSIPNIWTYIGGKIEYNGTHPNPNSHTHPQEMIFSNSCATRMSRALNYSGGPIHHHSTGTASGGDGKWYLFRVADLHPELVRHFGRPKALNLANWRKDIAGKTGVLEFSASWANSTGHFTLWDGGAMINGANDEADAKDPAINGVKFWEVK
jgi:hypothetical protein